MKATAMLRAGCGRAIPGNWTARERPALGWLASGSPAS
jgi:hypothetical protein